MEFQGVPTLGIGVGSRSYAPDVHYCLPYKVQGKYVNEIVQNYITCDFKDVVYDGFLFNEEEKKRKFVLLSLLDPGLDTSQYQLTFNEFIEVIFNDELQALKENELIESKDGVFLRLPVKVENTVILQYIFSKAKTLKIFMIRLFMNKQWG
ncbi:hypothetical protein [Paenibacillus planticolens]|uniref:Uncharacterized protein n=1 Tax=Paenibacillus planticolens TaxID=2654976 RepID=A0ABX1ZHT9_9BACL|nr:hypothetical protein [Paenibacillus planticolens]NOU99440.1 hypothetical protein [Paenibacillus planticolens]